MSKTNILVINDTHVGSVWGLWNPAFGTAIEEPKQKEAVDKNIYDLYESWLHFQKEITKDKPRVLILLGDILEGYGRSSAESELLTKDGEVQVQNAKSLLKPIIEANKIAEGYVFSGSDYHEDLQHNLERDLASELDLEYCGVGPKDLCFLPSGVRINFAHGGGAVTWYRGTKLDKIGFAMLLNIASEPIYNARYIVRAHWHFEAHLHYRHQDIFVSPCWQAQTDYMRKRDPLKLVPNIGSLLLSVDDDGTFKSKFYSYRHPEIPMIEVKGVAVHKNESKKVRELKKW